MDQNYANAYMKTATASLQDHVNLLLHSKTENIILNDIIISQSNQIQNLEGKINTLIEELNNKNSVSVELESIRNENNVLRNRAASLDTAINQINEMKALVISKDQELENLRLNHKMKIDILKAQIEQLIKPPVVFDEEVELPKSKRKSKLVPINNF